MVLGLVVWLIDGTWVGGLTYRWYLDGCPGLYMVLGLVVWLVDGTWMVTCLIDGTWVAIWLIDGTWVSGLAYRWYLGGCPGF